jgi:Rps23 Pro-64 3,4-dihydroxylase Tpa1-like proline 4-hydroxylase
MTSRELMDSFYESLMWDERILTARERELLIGLLQRTRANANGEELAVQRSIAQAVGETVAQRAYEALGESITRRLLEQPKPFYANSSAAVPDLQSHVSHPGAGSRFPGSSLPGSGVWSPPGGSPGPQPPGPPSARMGRAKASAAAVMDIPKTLRADCLILEEFLAPAEMDSLLQYTLDQESAFRISEVIQPGAAAGTVDYDQRRSRVLMELGEHHKVIADHIYACLPRVLTRLGHDTFAVSDVEAQITASNDGDYFHRHADNAQADNSSREITFVYFFHQEPKKFQGGELRVYDSRRGNEEYVPTENCRSVVPQQNQMVLFSSSLMHEITTVECSSRAFADSRFTVNGWLHR